MRIEEKWTKSTNHNVTWQWSEVRAPIFFHHLLNSHVRQTYNNIYEDAQKVEATIACQHIRRYVWKS